MGGAPPDLWNEFSQSLIARRADALFTIIDDEAVIMSEENDLFFSINPVGTVIWETLAAPSTLDEICAAIATRFSQTEPQKVRADAQQFIAQLAARNLIISRAPA